jgi:ATP-dependent exoDNAse (exonuclease V) alpha subunit
MESGTLQSFLMRGANPETTDKRHFYFVDESSLASTNQMREFLSRIGAHDRVILIGDTRQHQGVSVRFRSRQRAYGRSHEFTLNRQKRQ